MTTSMPSPETVVRHELPNGITLLVYENHSSPAVVVAGYLWAGAMSEPAEQAGLASFTAHMLVRGTETRTFGQINEMLESVGAQFSFRSAVHSVSFGGKALAEDVDLLLETLSGSLQRPTFPQNEVEKLRGQILTGIRRRAHDTQRMARLTFDDLLYPDHPYGRSVVGYEDTITGLGRDDLEAYYRDRYTPAGMVVAVVGAVPAAAARDKVQAALGAWQAPEAQPNRNVPPAVTLNERRRRSAPIQGKSQADIVLGWPGLARNDPDFMKVRLTNTVLGVFGMMGRLGDNVREQQGLAYYVYSQFDAGVGAGPWRAIAGVDPDHVERAVGGILDEVRRLRDEPVPAEELADSQSFLTGSMPLRLETNEGLAAVILDMERYGLGLDYLQRHDGLVQAVTAADLQEMAQKYLHPEHYALAVAGPED